MLIGTAFNSLILATVTFMTEERMLKNWPAARAEARMGLLMVVNVLNELLLKPAWEGVPVER